MGKIKVVSSSHALVKKKRHLQDYFDPHSNNIPTPNQRSLPKYKNLFPREHRPNLKKKDIATKRLSQGRFERRR